MDHQGVFIALESNSYSQTQAVLHLLAARLSTLGYPTESMFFPRRDRASSYYVSQYEAGQYAIPDTTNVYVASILYSLEHFDNARNILEAKNNGGVTLANGYSGSSMATFGAYFKEAEQRRGFYVWLDHLEHEVMNVPRPDKTFVLNSQTSTGTNLYQEIAQLLTKDFTVIDCLREDKELDPQTVEDILWKTISSTLITNKPPSSLTKVKDQKEVKTPNEQTTKPNGSLTWQSFVRDKLSDVANQAVRPKLKTDETESYYIRAVNSLRKSAQELSASIVEKLKQKGVSHKQALTHAIETSWSVLPVAILKSNDLNIKPAVNHKLEQTLSSSLGHGDGEATTKLVRHAPPNEYSLLVDMVYPDVNSSESELRTAIDNLPIDQKQKLLIDNLKKLKNSKSKLSAINISYGWEFVSSYAILLYVKQLFSDANFTHQLLNPRLGYETPNEIDELELNDEYESAFDLSLKLFSEFQSKLDSHVCQLLTLAGHKVRWSVTFSLNDSLKLKESLVKSKNQEMLTMAAGMIEQLSTAHPLITQQLFN